MNDIDLLFALSAVSVRKLTKFVSYATHFTMKGIKMKKTMVNLCVVAMMAGVSGAALAAESTFYGAVDVGRTTVKDMCVGATTCNNTPTGFRAGVGYQVNPSFAVEGSYGSYGTATASGAGTVGAPPVAATVTMNAAVSGFQLAAVGTLPMSDSFALTGKLGAAFSSVKLSGTLTPVGGAPISASLSANSTTLVYGIGARYNMSKDIALRVQYEDLGNVGNAATGKNKISFLSLGVTFGF